ncbi:hypothetical protein Leryth_023536 [Lithospermum erythrorhizon]|nr:hypothetical protein Leryth_023536 [Lithospermum erythrorhizon]
MKKLPAKTTKTPCQPVIATGTTTAINPKADEPNHNSRLSQDVGDTCWRSILFRNVSIKALARLFVTTFIQRLQLKRQKRAAICRLAKDKKKARPAASTLLHIPYENVQFKQAMLQFKKI